MNKRVECPVCGARSSLSSFELNGCWSCARATAQIVEDSEFEAFMLLDESERWRQVWLATINNGETK